MSFMQYDYEPRSIYANVQNVPTLVTNLLCWFDDLLDYTYSKFY